MGTMPALSGDEERRLEAPSFLRIDFRPNLAGVAVRISHGPSAGDPLDQRGTVRHFKTIDDATGALPDLITAHLDAHHEEAKLNRRLPDA